MDDVARVYARSLFEAAEGQGRLDLVREQLGQVADAVAHSHDLTTFFFSPHFSAQEKTDGLGRMLEGADPLIENVLALMIENHRMPALMRMRKAYDVLCDVADRRLPVTITSAIPLDEKTVAQITDNIAAQSGQTIELTKTVDPSILGGLIVRVGNAIIAASIHNRLEQLRRSVAHAV